MLQILGNQFLLQKLNLLIEKRRIMNILQFLRQLYWPIFGHFNLFLLSLNGLLHFLFFILDGHSIAIIPKCPIFFFDCPFLIQQNIENVLIVDQLLT